MFLEKIETQFALFCVIWLLIICAALALLCYFLFKRKISEITFTRFYFLRKGFVKNVFTELGSTFAAFPSLPNDDDSESPPAADDIEYIAIEDTTSDNHEPVLVGLVCWDKRKKIAKGLGVLMGNAKMSGDKKQLCQQIINEFNKKSGIKVVEKKKVKTYFSKENIIFCLYIIRYIFIAWVDASVEKVKQRKK